MPLVLQTSKLSESPRRFRQGRSAPGDFVCQPRAKKKRSTSIRTSTSWMGKNTGIARAPGSARAAIPPCDTKRIAAALCCVACAKATADRQRHPDREGSDFRQQPGCPGFLRQPALAQVPLLGVVHLVLQRRRAPRPQSRACGICPRHRAWTCSTSRSATASISTGCRATGGSWASTSRARSSTPAAAARPAGRSGWPSAKPKSCRSRAAQFDAVLSIGAFNYFNDPEGALREMVRVARPARRSSSPTNCPT